jgi:hypothetical protein
MATTGTAWDLSNPDKPVAKFDPDAIRDIPMDWSEWLTDIGSTYSSHLVTAPAPLEMVSSSESSGVITARIKVATAATYTLGTKCPVTYTVTAANGEKDERTVWLKLVQR